MIADRASREWKDGSTTASPHSSWMASHSHGVDTPRTTSVPGRHKICECGCESLLHRLRRRRDYHNVSAPTWLGGDNYDFGEIEQMVTTVLQANPEAKLMMRVALDLPPFWFEEHPDSITRVRTTDGREVEWLETNSLVGTMASQAWREQQAIALKKLIEYCASRPWASQVVGFNISGGMTEEWFAWASNDAVYGHIRCFGDYSPHE